MPLHARIAAVSNETLSGSGIRFSAGARTTSANPPVKRESELADRIDAERLAPGAAGAARPQPTKL